MKRDMRGVLTALVLVALAALSSPGVKAQSPTAEQPRQLSTFVAGSGVLTGLAGGKNASITAGVDLGLRPHHGIRPTIEVRGTYPIHKGEIDAQKSILAGVRADFLLGRRFHPYVDFLIGRGETDYPTGYLFQNFEYDLTTNLVYSPGVGVDYDLSHHLAIKADYQFQHWGAAPTTSGSVYPQVGTVGVVYRFDFNHHYRR